MNSKSDTAKFIDSLDVAQDEVADHEQWMQIQTQFAKDLAEDSMATNQDPNMESNWKALMDLLSHIQECGKKSTQKLKNHLQDITEPFETGQFRVNKVIIQKSHCSDCCNW